MKKKYLVVGILSSAVLTGCSGKVETRYERDRLTGEEIRVVTETPSFWESENQKNYLEFEERRFIHVAKAAEQKIEAITLQTARTVASLEGNVVAQQLANINGMLAIQMVQTVPGPSGVQMPKNMADFWGTNMVALGNLFLNAYQVFGKDYGDSWSQQMDSPNITITGNGNSTLFKSDGSMNPAYSMSVGEGTNSLTLPGIGGYSESNSSTENKGDSSNGLSLF